MFYSTLEIEVSTLCQAIERLSAASSVATYVGMNAIRAYAGAAPQPLLGHGGPAKLSTNPSIRTQKSDTTARNDDARPGKHSNSREKVKVDSVRRIWNTIPTCTIKAIAATISKLAAPTKFNLHFKCKNQTPTIEII